ncbi:glycoside hydrolase family 13 protein [Solihabitans fulvus]|uniref:Glycoside hydrolase family 13 protein n=1 Tax=Solihabitans fulvus TaxID=1892852 RepID=A0A5B2XCS4_9PSEU|nr:glycoside hydrolase family 13 protein [Solihabitans fulvus]KAA2261113.1 glycoside hydrolase family 13 protein [Solihabitans fulvus]
MTDPAARTQDALATAAALRADRPDWWRDAVYYTVYPRSFADGNGDGIGDLPGLTSRLDHLVDLGVDAVWLGAFYRSPMVDGGYDVADHTDVDPEFGTLADFDAMTAAAHERGLKVTIDVIPNHVSDQHPWFVEALTAAPGSPARERFIFCDGRGPGGDEPPNNWVACFGGSAWARVPDGQWYLHLFTPQQPDLNWENPEVVAEYDRVLRFWLNRGVDGLRVDVAHGMAKPNPLRDMTIFPEPGQPRVAEDPRLDQDGVHEHLRGFRRVLDTYPGTMAVGEVWVESDERLARYVRPDELHLTFNFKLVEAEWGAAAYRAAIDGSLRAMADVGAPCSWVLTNHDIPRPVTRYGDGDIELGRRRARAAALVQLSLPGSVYLYQGDELGLDNVDDLPVEALRDPTWENSGHTVRGRDGVRVPIPWSGDAPPYGFGGADTWLPMPTRWAGLTAEAQAADADSTLSLHRRALEIRRASPQLGRGTLTWLDSPADVLAYRCAAEGHPDIEVWLNSSADSIAPPSAATPLLASGPLGANGSIPPDTAAWFLGPDPR